MMRLVAIRWKLCGGQQPEENCGRDLVTEVAEADAHVEWTVSVSKWRPNCDYRQHGNLEERAICQRLPERRASASGAPSDFLVAEERLMIARVPRRADSDRSPISWPFHRRTWTHHDSARDPRNLCAGSLLTWKRQYHTALALDCGADGLGTGMRRKQVVKHLLIPHCAQTAGYHELRRPSEVGDILASDLVKGRQLARPPIASDC
eukprot:3649014-Prymnesium_polylepis.1